MAQVCVSALEENPIVLLGANLGIDYCLVVFTVFPMKYLVHF
jgi:hypothetical protein